MADFNLVVLYVNDAQASSTFYQTLLGCPVAQSSPKFVVLPLGSGVMLGLWQRDAVVPPSASEAGCNEICSSEISWAVANAEAVRATHDTWLTRGVRIAQPPTAMPFGDTFVALDPDGHRLRVLATAA
ncbi:VOC family protein [Bradyrhizobium sp. WYCCWR 13023]|uniref:VOC family protein n=1 Tax=Bradyrhizobium zhengyangense TaxID=2911009 RepID=A0A9X1UJL7_9BRAD|nr:MULTISPECIES: VOC family protein [Bradyrhizobium]MCG2631637.1 VOC family protein [Bradyrhizobium zhengyangense]MCG2644794.1 VOC family protein [Bradyrhizobium zhengyangense]MCG2667052.1 VOC family protein [Bradyrhizobium zhengyangense]MDA9522383.1 drug:proton antiporter [Bradyrhizobium sp. CCBAU 11434]